MEPAVLFVLGVAAAAALGIRRIFQPPRQKPFVAFARSAALLGGKYIPSTYLPRLEARLHDVDLVARLQGVDQLSRPRPLETEVLAHAPGAPLLMLLPRGVATTIGAALGGQDVATATGSSMPASCSRPPTRAWRAPGCTPGCARRSSTPATTATSWSRAS